MIYIFSYRKRFLWHRAKVIGHRFMADLNKMVLYFSDGGLEEIAEWSKCDLKLGPDWLLAEKKSKEAQAGQSIPVNNAQ